MTLQTNSTGQIFDSNDPNHPTADEVLDYLRQSLLTNGWVGQISFAVRTSGSRKVKFVAEISKDNTSYNLEIYVFRNLAFAHRDNMAEKRIQLIEEYQHHSADFPLPYENNHYCLLLGIYAPTPNEIIFCAWKASAYVNHGKSRSCYTKTGVIRDAYMFGLAATLDDQQRRTYAFRPEFFHYYLNNIANMHAEGAGGEPPQPNLVDVVPVHRLTGGCNAIRYGAPGTGKSYNIDQEIAGHCNFRTVFHPTLEQSDFFGSLKPVVIDEKVQYKFVPGPFCEALVKALNNPGQRVNLVF
jgi:hypothetical protein